MVASGASPYHRRQLEFVAFLAAAAGFRSTHHVVTPGSFPGSTGAREHPRDVDLLALHRVDQHALRHHQGSHFALTLRCTLKTRLSR
jgi:hypothetical protein